jgi:hypothetical protein
MSSLYANAILMHYALTATHGGISATFTSEQHLSVTFEDLTRKWNIGLETAKQTLQVTIVYPLHR